METGAFAFFAFHYDFSLHFFYCRFHNGQTQTIPGNFLISGRVCPIKADMRQMFRRNADAGIRHFQMELILFYFRRQTDAAALSVILYGIGQQIFQQKPHQDRMGIPCILLHLLPYVLIHGYSPHHRSYFYGIMLHMDARR